MWTCRDNSISTHTHTHSKVGQKGGHVVCPSAHLPACLSVLMSSPILIASGQAVQIQHAHASRVGQKSGL